MNQLIDRCKEYYYKLKDSHADIRSLAFVKLVILISFLPIIIYLAAWLYTIYAVHIGINAVHLVALLGELRQFVSVIFSTQTVTGILAYGVALIDKDHDGESDELDIKAHKDEVKQNIPTDTMQEESQGINVKELK